MNLRKIAIAILLSSATTFANVSPYLAGQKTEVIKQDHLCYSKYGCIAVALNKKITINTKAIQDFYQFVSVLSTEAGVPIIVKIPPSYRLKPIAYFAENKTLREILQEIASYEGLYVKLTPRGIILFRYESKTFRIPVPFTKKTIDMMVSSSQGGKEFETQYKSSYLENLENKLKALLTDPISKVSVSENGFVFVYGTPDEIEAIKRAIQTVSDTVNKAIPLQIRLYLVKLDKNSELGIDWQALFRDKTLGITFNGNTPFMGQTYLQITANSLLPNLKALLLKALKGKGEVKEISDIRANVLNGQPFFYSVLNKKRIISKYNLTYISTENGTSTPALSVETEDVSSGKKLVIVPYQINGDRVVLDFFTDLSQINSINYQTINLQGFQNQVALPDTTENPIAGQVILRRGETLILASSTMTGEELKKYAVPILGEIPILGALFSYTKKDKTKYQLIIAVSYLP